MKIWFERIVHDPRSYVVAGCALGFSIRNALTWEFNLLTLLAVAVNLWALWEISKSAHGLANYISHLSFRAGDLQGELRVREEMSVELSSIKTDMKEAIANIDSPGHAPDAR